MRNFLRFSFLGVLILSLVSCSMMIEDLKNCTKGSKYLVQHYQEIVAEYKMDDSEYKQTNLDADGKPVYAFFESETLRGEPGTLTNATPKSYDGFTSQSFEQEIIEEDESCVVKIYYNRKKVCVTVDIGDGMWNYSQKKLDDSVAADKTPRTVTKKFGSATDLDAWFESSGKKGCALTKFKLSDGSDIPVLPNTFPADDETYTAVWEEGKPTNYKVVHHFEKIGCPDNSIESDENYEVRSDLTATKQGVPENETQTQDSSVTVPGFTVKPHSEKEIAANGSTVVDIFYVRNPYVITVSTDEGLWNYDAWKSDKSVKQDTELKTLDGKFGSEIDWRILGSLKKTGMNLVGLKDDVTGETVSRKNLPQTMPAKNISYTAQWTKKSAVAYEVRFMTEKVGSTNSDDPKNYVLHSSDNSKTGTPEYFTEAVAKEIPGFTAKEIVQEEIKEDGTTQVNVYYTRDSYKIRFDLNGGYWNYLDYRDNKSLSPDSAAKDLTGKFEENVVLPDFSKIGKRANDFVGWKNLSDLKIYTIGELTTNFAKFNSSNVEFLAQWEKGEGFEYTVHHWFEKVDSKDSSNNSNYVLDDSLTQKELGEEIGDNTEAVAKTVEGFTSKSFSQKQIEADGKTVVDIYYTRNSSKFIFDANGGTIDGQSQVQVSGKFGSVFDSSTTPSATKSGWTFGGWTYNGKLVTNSNLQLENQSFAVEDKTFQAYWKSTVSVKTVTTFGDIGLVKNQTTDNVTCSVTLPIGYENENWTYKWYVDGVYTSDEKVFSRTNGILGKGVHTITLKATMNGQNFTARVTATVN